MTATEARAIFDSAIASTTDADAIARLELVREYFCNPEFRCQLAEFLYEATTQRQNDA